MSMHICIHIHIHVYRLSVYGWMYACMCIYLDVNVACCTVRLETRVTIQIVHSAATQLQSNRKATAHIVSLGD